MVPFLTPLIAYLYVIFRVFTAKTTKEDWPDWASTNFACTRY